MNKQIIGYLQQNKDNYTKESLVQQLRNAGYPEQDIQDGVNYVYNTHTYDADTVLPSRKLGKIEGSFALVKQSFAVLKKDKELMMFPIISSIVSLLIGITFILPVVLFSNIFTQNMMIMYFSIFLFYTVMYFVVAFFNSGLITCANIRLSGGNPTFNDGIQNAFSHIGSIFIWALISATVGTVLQILINQLEKFGTAGQLVGRFVIDSIGFVWGLVTYFVVPVIIIENVKPKQAIKDSVKLFKKTWGENVIGNFSINIFFVLLGFIVIVPLVLAVATGSLNMVLIVAVLSVLYWICLGIVSASLKGIFITALYIYAKTGIVPDAFEESIIVNAFKKKQDKKTFSLGV